jgi:DNA polymerase
MSLCFFDFETCSALDLTIVGGAKYSRDPSTFPLVLSWAIDDGPVKLWVPELGNVLPKATWDFIVGMVDYTGAFPKELHDFAKGEGNYWVAWNAAFDRNIIQNCAHPRFGFPAVATTRVLDAMAQASASNLPGRLDMSGRMLGLGGKTEGGKTIMKMFADASAEMPTKIEHWKTYLTYAAKDTDLMRDIWRTTRPLDASEWVEYWVSERINDRGMLADLDVCRGALKYRAEEEEYNRAEIKRLTENMVPAVTMTRRINEWVFPRLPHDLQELMVKERNEDGDPTKLTLSKDVIGRMLEEINISDTPPEDDVVEVLELLQFGRASSAVKFEKILNQADDGRLKGSYVFNGAGQTGRFSSRGVQVHNLPRKSMSTKQQPTLELDLLDMVAAQVPIEVIRSYGPVSSTLSKLIRPTFIAPPKRKLVWGDWSAIEARVAPWLANSRSAQTAVLDAFETGADLYILNAESIFGIPADVIQERYDNGDKEANEMRQSGKVAVLALGFLGGVGALKAMARGYGMKLSNEAAQKIVDGWRDRNRWARVFGVQCEDAAFAAISHAEEEQKAGRLSYVYIPQMMRGTLLCRLPDGRFIAYPMARIEDVERFGRPTKSITYLNGMGRRTLWNGLQIENATQGTAASMLRQTLVHLEQNETEAQIIGHTHDEVICEIDEDQTEAFADRLKRVMVAGFDWTKGLPLGAEVKSDWYYHK